MLNKIYTFLLADDNGIGGWLPLIVIMVLSGLSSLLKKKKDNQKIPPPKSKIKPKPTQHPGTIPSYARKKTPGQTHSTQPCWVQPPALPRPTEYRNPDRPNPDQPNRDRSNLDQPSRAQLNPVLSPGLPRHNVHQPRENPYLFHPANTRLALSELPVLPDPKSPPKNLRGNNSSAKKRPPRRER